MNINVSIIAKIGLGHHLKNVLLANFLAHHFHENLKVARINLALVLILLREQCLKRLLAVLFFLLGEDVIFNLLLIGFTYIVDHFT